MRIYKNKKVEDVSKVVKSDEPLKEDVDLKPLPSWPPKKGEEEETNKRISASLRDFKIESILNEYKMKIEPTGGLPNNKSEDYAELLSSTTKEETPPSKRGKHGRQGSTHKRQVTDMNHLSNIASFINDPSSTNPADLPSILNITTAPPPSSLITSSSAPVVNGLKAFLSQMSPPSSKPTSSPPSTSMLSAFMSATPSKSPTSTTTTSISSSFTSSPPISPPSNSPPSLDVFDEDNIITIDLDGTNVNNKTRTCLIPECNELRVLRGYCTKHSTEDANRKVQVTYKKRHSHTINLENEEITASLEPKSVKEMGIAQKCLTEDAVMILIKKACTLMRGEANVLELEAPFQIYGDIHGQFYDLINVLPLLEGELPDNQKFLFLGDYVDRGAFGCEVMLMLLSLKVKYPSRIFLLRGNHECRSVSGYFGFKEECVGKYGTIVYNWFVTLFECLPLAATVKTERGNYLCLHGGISPKITNISDINAIDRFSEPPSYGPLCDILWSDPLKEETFSNSSDTAGVDDFLNEDWTSNTTRGCSFSFGYRAIVKFLERNNFLSLIRAHEVQQNGYFEHFNPIVFKKKKGFNDRMIPPVITVFSAPNYCDKYGNDAAVMTVHKSGELSYKKYSAVEHPSPLLINSKQDQLLSSLKNQLPYMPLGFKDFVTEAMSLVEVSVFERLRSESSPVRTLSRAMSSSSSTFEVALGLGYTEAHPDSVKKRSNAAEELADYLQQLENPDLDDAGALESTSMSRLDSESFKFHANIKKKSPKKRGSIGEGGNWRKLDGITKLQHALEDHASTTMTKVPDVFSCDELVILGMMFSAMDRDHDDSLDLVDLMGFAEDSGDWAMTSEVEQVIKVLDKDGDGVVGFEDYLQFASGLKLQRLESSKALAMRDIEALQGKVSHRSLKKEKDIDVEESSIRSRK